MTSCVTPNGQVHYPKMFDAQYLGNSVRLQG